MKVLFLDSVHPILEEQLSSKGIICDQDYTSSSSEIISKIENYDGLVIRSRFKIDRDFLKQSKHLKFIARSGSGLENIDLISAKEFDIKIISSPEGNRDAVAEHAIGMILGLFNHLKRSDIEVRKAQWNREKNRGLELMGKTVGIIGYGVMGKALAKRLQGFGCAVIAFDKYKSDFGDEHVEEVSLDELQQRAEIVSLHLPYSEETKYYVNKKFINSFDHPFYLVNTARGQHVKITDLNKAIKSGKILGACLDVLEYEKTSFENIDASQLPQEWQELINSNRVLFSPHVAGWTEESYVKLSTFLAEKIFDFLEIKD